MREFRPTGRGNENNTIRDLTIFSTRGRREPQQVARGRACPGIRGNTATTGSPRKCFDTGTATCRRCDATDAGGRSTVGTEEMVGAVRRGGRNDATTRGDRRSRGRSRRHRRHRVRTWEKDIG